MDELPIDDLPIDSLPLDEAEAIVEDGVNVLFDISPDIQEMLLLISEQQIQLLEIVNDIRNLLFFSIVAIGVILIFFLIWRTISVFI